MTDTAPAEPSTLEEDRLTRLASLWTLTPENLRGKLPKPYKKDAEKGQCKDCGGYHGLPAMHLDYLGHADTCRLIAEKDILWQWEPKGGWEPNGEPVFVRNNGGYPIALWIDLTICGVTRPGVGTVTTGKGDPEKELIGDAIRNAAMRFGVGADMWSKAHHAEIAAEDGTERTYSRAAAPVDRFVAAGWMSKDHHDEKRTEIGITLSDAPGPVKTTFRQWYDDQQPGVNVPQWREAWPHDFAVVVENKLRNLLDEAERTSAPGGNDEKTPSAPEPTHTPEAPSLPLPEPEKPKPARRGTGGPLVKCGWCGLDIKDEAAIPVTFKDKSAMMHGRCKSEFESDKAANPNEPF